MAEALKLLRQYVMEKKEFTEDDDKIIFGDIAYPKEAKTNYMIYEYVFI
jgi:parafibromin